MEVNETTLAYIARQMGISRGHAAELMGAANKKIKEVLAENHVFVKSQEHYASLELETGQVDLSVISAKLGLPLNEFSSWVEDEMVWVQFGSNFAEGIDGSGPTAQSAIADFYSRWYNEVISRHRRILLSDGRHHYYDNDGEI